MMCLSINSKEADTVIFDFDGTLAELNIDFDFMRKSVDRIIDSYGIDHTDLKNGYILEKMHEAESLLKISAPDKALLFISEAFQAIEKIEVEAASQGRLFDTTKDLLTTLAHHNIQTGIITRNCSRAVHTVFPDISEHCPILICREDVKKTKPDPGHLLKALHLLNANIKRSIMIGDHPLDIDTGRNAGTLSAGVMTGHFKEADFMNAGADAVFNQAADILNHLKNV